MNRALRQWTPAVVLAILFAHEMHGTPLWLVLTALIPALGYSFLVVWLDRHDREPAAALAAVFLWGAVPAASLSLWANDAVRAWAGAGQGWVGVVAGPLVEEAAKGGALLALYAWRRTELDGVLDGIVYGALVGIGFAMSENVAYFTLAAVQGGEPALLQSIYTRAVVGGFNHAAFTACFGAAFGFWRQGKSVWILPIGFAVAVAQHALWNGIASSSIAQLLCGAGRDGLCLVTPSAFNLLVMIPLVVLGFLGPGGLILLVIARLAGERDRVRRAGATIATRSSSPPTTG